MKINKQTQEKWSKLLIKFLPDSQEFLYKSNDNETTKYVDPKFFSSALENLDSPFTLNTNQTRQCSHEKVSRK